jgi:hypothetical protein
MQALLDALITVSVMPSDSRFADQPRDLLLGFHCRFARIGGVKTVI